MHTGSFDAERTYPLASSAAYVVVVARKALMHRKIERGSMAGRTQSDGRFWTLRVSEFFRRSVGGKKDA